MLIALLSSPQKFVKFVLFFLIPFLLFISLSFLLLKNYIHHDGIDFNAYITGALIVKENPQHLYDLPTQMQTQYKILGEKHVGVLSFRNTPVVAALYIPYTFFNLNQAYLINYFVQISLTLLYIYLLYKIVNTKKWLILLALTFWPSIFQPVYGQIAIIISLVILGIYYFAKTNRFLLAGIVSAFLLLKIQYLVFVLYLFLFIKKKTNFAIGFISALIVLVIVDSIIYKSFYLFDYLHFLLTSESPLAGTNLTTLYTIIPIFRLFGASSLVLNLILIAAFFGILLLVALKSNKIPFDLLFASSILFSISVNIHSTLVDLIALLIPIFILAKSKSNNSKYLILVLYLIPLTSSFELTWLGGLLILACGIAIFFLNDSLT